MNLAIIVDINLFTNIFTDSMLAVSVPQSPGYFFLSPPKSKSCSICLHFGVADTTDEFSLRDVFEYVLRNGSFMHRIYGVCSFYSNAYPLC